jgi:hypothetical protein
MTIAGYVVAYMVGAVAALTVITLGPVVIRGLAAGVRMWTAKGRHDPL